MLSRRQRHCAAAATVAAAAGKLLSSKVRCLQGRAGCDLRVCPRAKRGLAPRGDPGWSLPAKRCPAQLPLGKASVRQKEAAVGIRSLQER